MLAVGEASSASSVWSAKSSMAELMELIAEYHNLVLAIIIIGGYLIHYVLFVAKVTKHVLMLKWLVLIVHSQTCVLRPLKKLRKCGLLRQVVSPHRWITVRIALLGLKGQSLNTGDCKDRFNCISFQSTGVQVLFPSLITVRVYTLDAVCWFLVLDILLRLN